MTSDELNRAIEFLTRQAANFWAGMEDVKQSQKEVFRGLADLKEQTARFETWAAELVAIRSRRLDEHDRLYEQQRNVQEQQRDLLEEQRRINDEILRKIDIIIDRLLPTKN
jgi:hypothetical protein